MNVKFIIKAKFLCAHQVVIYVPPIILTTEPKWLSYFEHITRFLLYTWHFGLFLEAHLNTCYPSLLDK